MNRRDALRTLAGLGLVGLAGCSGPPATGEVATNDTDVAVTDHRAGFRATAAGTELYVTVEFRNEGEEAITPAGTVPQFSCSFFTADGERLYRASKEMTRPLNADSTREFTFELHQRADEADRYEVGIERVEA
ncbi:hypothetical protein [Halorientalis litorea]|jgi:hypothetical protein|uniref:hypothetical protein n=1 Tax=Halorientalis litorea TaxID=2931977 RepID=UPI001FF6926B|nr:hypothetical protein [Halorientalis litorea]